MVSPAEFQLEANVATSTPGLQSETHEVVHPAELQPNVNMTTSSPEHQCETHSDIDPDSRQ